MHGDVVTRWAVLYIVRSVIGWLAGEDDQLYSVLHDTYTAKHPSDVFTFLSQFLGKASGICGGSEAPNGNIPVPRLQCGKEGLFWNPKGSMWTY